MKRPTARLAALAAALLVWVQPAAAQSILRDAETEAMFHDMSADIVKAAGLNPRDVQIVLINDGSINAFVAGGQIVYIHSGLIEAASNANEVQGVIAHEVGHIADGHVLSGEAAMKPAMGMTILSMVLGLAAMAAGSGDAGAGIMAMGQQAAMGKYLSFSRTQESTADASAVRYLDTAGVSGKGMLTFFKKLANQEYRYGTANIDPFMQTHPLSGERIANLTADIQKSKSYNAKPDAALEERFRRVKAKLLGYVAEPSRTLAEYPETDQSLYAHYARAYAYHKGGYPDKADAEAAALIVAQPHDPYFQEIQGQILLEAGKPRLALGPLRAATEGSRNNPLIATTYGHALIATEDKANLPEAIRVLRIATQRDDDNPWAWMQLGTAYEQSGDSARAALATAERAQMTGDQRTAVQSARYAMANIPANTPDWIRAQDIAMTSGDAMASDRKKKKR
ncbi:putative Zn-dependent protease [Sphingomonas sp. SORGH_AS802]|uniref:M48 family metalloprotease n=1 Tax=unclassified Sphingomonas TaxID=196159 RepID=UPI0028679075|nr:MULTISPECIES: M48 family metalloprotease [unclassified Sphingomonas]MDR6125443.1 putative Zn-dependent protease [Sphingomonas sp. SORGH_AS_0438]MDR6134059.1 putative Zn-dependent protease [Sphingomonas sp. SORGH_AS_0802]